MPTIKQVRTVPSLAGFILMVLVLFCSKEAGTAMGQVGSASGTTQTLGLSQLMRGDVILIELNCQTCSVISESTGSVFSHSGLVFDSSESGFMVAQSLTGVETIPLERFLKQAKPKGAVKVLRSRELWKNILTDIDRYKSQVESLKKIVTEEYLGLPFDDQFLWDNFDADGREFLYCSELVQKALNRVLEDPIEPVSMDFSAQWDFWERYYKGKVPQGLAGNSPASLERSPEFISVF